MLPLEAESDRVCGNKLSVYVFVIHRAEFQLDSNTGSGNRRTCRLTLVPDRGAELPAACAGALVGRVAWFAELRASLVILQGAHSLVCIAETEERGCGTHAPHEK